MKWLISFGAAALVAAAVLLAGCGTAPMQNVAAFKAQVVRACEVYTPVSQSVEALYALDPKVVAVGSALRGVCSAQDSIDPTNLKTLVDSTIPAALAAIKGAALPEVTNALLLVQVALSAALAAYGPVPAAPVAASN